MPSPRILIVGGVAGGASAATRARRMNESAEIVIFEKGKYGSFANCGLPYHISNQIADRQKLIVATPKAFKDTFRIDVHTGHEVTRIDRSAKQIEVLNLANGDRRMEPYDKLILAPGASPIVLPWAKGDYSNVHTLRDLTNMDRIKSFIKEAKPERAVVVGAGFIGLEMVEVLSGLGLKVAVVELQPQVLPPLDLDMAREVEAVLRSRGVELHLGKKVEDVTASDGRISSLRLADGREMAADLVMLSIGVRPNTELAVDTGLTIGPSGGISVNEYLQTDDANIYAVGDAAEVMHEVTGTAARIPLAGPANRNGRLAGEHAATGKCRAATPAAGTAIVGLFSAAAAMTGLSIKAARKAGMPCAVTYALRPHHAGYYPGAEQMVLKLIYDPQTLRVLGGQAVGGAGVDKRIDVIATMIRLGGTIDDLAGVDLAYAPQFGSAKDPVHIAAFVAQNQLDGLLKQLLPGDSPIGKQHIDVRSKKEFDKGHLKGATNIPLDRLRDELGSLNKEEAIMVNCGVGQRSYYAVRILMQNGFHDIWNLAGGYRMHRSTWGKGS